MYASATSGSLRLLTAATWSSRSQCEKEVVVRIIVKSKLRKLIIIIIIIRYYWRVNKSHICCRYKSCSLGERYKVRAYNEPNTMKSGDQEGHTVQTNSNGILYGKCSKRAPYLALICNIFTAIRRLARHRSSAWYIFPFEYCEFPSNITVEIAGCIDNRNRTRILSGPKIIPFFTPVEV
jgi:hypothetical protein